MHTKLNSRFLAVATGSLVPIGHCTEMLHLPCWK